MFTNNCFVRCPLDYKLIYHVCGTLHHNGYEGPQNDSMRYVDVFIEAAIRECKRNKIYIPIIYKFLLIK